MYCCDICGYTTKYKSNFIKHSKRKNPCKKIDQHKPYSCKYCNINFSNRQLKYKHQNICSLNKMNENTLDEMKQSYHLLQKDMKNLKSLVTNSSLEVNNYNIENNIENNIEIVINNYGNENRKYMTDTYMSKLLELPFSAIKKYVKNLHFNPKHPENHNVKITNKKQPYIYIYNNEKWFIEDKTTILEDIVDNSYFVIDGHYEINEDALSDNQRSRYKTFQNKYETKDKDLKKKLLKDVELTILNK